MSDFMIREFFFVVRDKLVCFIMFEFCGYNEE